MSKKKPSEEIRIDISKGSGGNNITHLRVSVPPQFKSGLNKFQSRGKSLVVLAPQISKRNLKTIFTDTGKIMQNIIEKNYPKTKLSARDKSQDHRSPSPRLKTFPAEKIKKIDGNTLLQQPIIPQLNYDKPFYTPQPEQNIGYGDTLATSLQIQITPRHQPKNSSISQQNVPHTYRIGNPNQSEGVLPSQKPEATGGQSHRPFVPNLPNGVAIREVSPEKQVTPGPIISHMPTIDLTSQSNQEKNNIKTKEQKYLKPLQNPQQEFPELSSEIPEHDYKKQPVGGRIAALHRQRILERNQVPHQIQQLSIPHHQTQQQQIQQYPIQQLSYNQITPPVSHDHILIAPNAAPSKSVRQPMQPTPQQVYQQLQQNAAYQRELQQRSMAHQEQMKMNQMQQRAYYDYYNQQQQKTQEFRTPGMTSPQDRSINRERNHHLYHMQMPAGNHGYPQNSVPSSKDDPNVRAQIHPFAIDLVTPHRTQHQSQVQTTEWQQSGQNDTPKKQNDIQTSQNILQNNQNSLQNNSNSDQIRSIPQQQIEVLDTQQKKSEGKKVYHFTPQMTRDQEQLISTMQQQRIPEEVMQRQFQLLLNEQKKQLAYLELLAQGEDIVDKSPAYCLSKKITKIQTDQKPEWMAHITPPRIPYSDLEKVKNYPMPQNMQSMQQHNQERVHHEEDRSNQVQLNQCQHHQHYQQQVQNQQKEFQHNQQKAAHQQQIQHQHYESELQQHQIHPQNQITIQQKQANQQEHQIHQQNIYQNCQHQMMNEHKWSNHPMMIPNSYHPYERTRSLSMPFSNINSPNHLQHQHVQYNYPHKYYQQLQPQAQEQTLKNWEQSNPAANPNPELHLKMIPHQLEESDKRVEPSSLLQLRLYKEVIQPQKRNNGLQDSETVKEALEALKNAETKKGLEYLVNLNKKEVVVRLNGAQEPGEIPGNFLQWPPESFQEMPKQVSANGLENKRNPNNPPPPPAAKIKYLEEQSVEFPRSKNSYKNKNYTYVVERENGSVAPVLHHHQNSQSDYAYNQTSSKNVSPMQNLGNNWQLQQFYKNRQMASDAQGDAIVPELREISGNEYLNQPGGDQQNKIPVQQYGGLVMRSPNIQEPKIIGGVTYLARKPSYIPNVQVSTESYSGNNHILQKMVS